MTESLTLPEAAFAKVDDTPDTLFYRTPRLVTHIDERAVAAVTRLYGELFAPGSDLLDLMSSWVSHLPGDVAYREVVGHGMNADELAANPRLARWFVQDLNRDPHLPLPAGTFDGASMCVSVQYLQRPIEVLTEVARVLRPGSPVVITFSNRCFPTKAVAIWTSLHAREQAELVGLYLTSAGFAEVDVREVLRPPGDPLWAVIGRTAVASSPVPATDAPR